MWATKVAARRPPSKKPRKRSLRSSCKTLFLKTIQRTAALAAKRTARSHSGDINPKSQLVVPNPDPQKTAATNMAPSARSTAFLLPGSTTNAIASCPHPTGYHLEQEAAHKKAPSSRQDRFFALALALALAHQLRRFILGILPKSSSGRTRTAASRDGATVSDCLFQLPKQLVRLRSRLLAKSHMGLEASVSSRKKGPENHPCRC